MTLPQKLPFDRASYLAQLDDGYEEEAARLKAAYKRTLDTLQPYAKELADKAKELADKGDLNAQRLRDGGLSRLLQQVERELAKYAVLIENSAQTAQDRAQELGLVYAKDSIAWQSQLVARIWADPNPEALKNLIGYTERDAFKSGIAKFGENAAMKLSDILLAGVSLGKNPRTISTIIANFFGIPYSWAENTIRTVQAWSFRTASHAAYSNNADVVAGWVWWATLDSRTCISCIAQHGKQFKHGDILNDHHRGRCTPVPVVKGAKWLASVQTGEDWFKAQPDSVQASIMGKGMHEHWRKGGFGFGDIPAKYTDPVYGEMLRPKTLKSLIGSKP